MIKGIFVNAGHGLGPTGAIDNGAVGNGTTERKEVVEVAQELCVRLSSDPDLSGIEIVRVGIDDRMMLKDMIRQVNDHCTVRGWKAVEAALVSIHINSAGVPTARGIEAWYSSKGKAGEVDLARGLSEQVSARTGMPLRPTSVLSSSANRLGRLGILDDTVPVAVLIEIGFITNEFDARVFKDAALDDAFAEGIHRGLRSWMSLPAVAGAGARPAAFRDVPSTAWYAGAVQTCLDAGIFTMPVDGMFHPERPVTRAELAAVIARHLQAR